MSQGTWVQLEDWTWGWVVASREQQEVADSLATPLLYPVSHVDARACGKVFLCQRLPVIPSSGAICAHALTLSSNVLPWLRVLIGHVAPGGALQTAVFQNLASVQKEKQCIFRQFLPDLASPESLVLDAGPLWREEGEPVKNGLELL